MLSMEDSTGEARPAAGKLKAALAGLDASKKMHDYLTNQQRRKEEYWLRKYGKILAPPPQRIQSERSHGHLPPIANNNTASVPRRRHRSGNPALSGSDRASQPGALRQPHPDRRHNVSNLQYHPMAPVQLPPLQSLPPPSKEPSGAMPSVMTSARTQELSATAFTATQPAQAGPTIAVAADGTAAVLGAEASKASDLGIQGSSLAAETSLSVLPGFRSGPVMHVAPHTNAVHHQQQQQQQHASAPPYHHVGPRVVTHNRGMRDLQLELAVLKAIKAREDVLDRLRVACDKLDVSLGGAAPLVLAATDPMVRLFYRLVGQLRSRTLDAVETLAAWHRRSQTTDHFVYYGTPYMTKIGQDLDFLDRMPFLRTRLHGKRATEDPFLCTITPDGLPIEEATSMDLRRGHQRFSSDALRIRVARKVLSMYCGHPTARALLSPQAESEAGTDPEAIYAEITGHRHAQHAQLAQLSSARAGTVSSSESSIRPDEEMQYQALVRQHNEGLAPFLEDVGEAEASFAIDQTSWGPMEVAAEATKDEIANLVVADVAMPVGTPKGPAGLAAEPTGLVFSPPLGTGGQEERRTESAYGSLYDSEASPRLAQQAEYGEVPDSAQAQHADAGSYSADHAQHQAEASAAMDAAMDAVSGLVIDDEHPAAHSTAFSQEDEPLPGTAHTAAHHHDTAAGTADADTAMVCDQGLGSAVACEEDAAGSLLNDPVAMAVSGALDYDLDDGAFIDFAVNAMVASLEPPYCEQFTNQAFTISGWEIDRQLDGLVDSLAVGGDAEGNQEGLEGLLEPLAA